MHAEHVSDVLEVAHSQCPGCVVIENALNSIDGRMVVAV